MKSLCMYEDEKSATALRAGSITRNDTSQALLDAPSSQTYVTLGFAAGSRDHRK